jgi:hypothetical protein
MTLPELCPNWREIFRVDATADPQCGLVVNLQIHRYSKPFAVSANYVLLSNRRVWQDAQQLKDPGEELTDLSSRQRNSQR